MSICRSLRSGADIFTTAGTLAGRLCIAVLGMFDGAVMLGTVGSGVLMCSGSGGGSVPTTVGPVALVSVSDIPRLNPRLKLA